MKKTFALILALVMVLSLAACGGDNDNTVAGGDTTPTTNTTGTTNGPTEGTQSSTEDTTPSTTEPPATNPPATQPPATTPPATEPQTTSPPITENTSSLSSNVTPEFKSAMDSYEKFFDEYIAFMNAYAKSSNALSMMDDYIKYLQQYTETMQKLSKIDTSSLSTADYAYYIEVNGRITKKILELGTTEAPGNSTDATTGPNDSSVNKGETTAESRNEQAVKAAEEIRDTYASVYPNMIENMLIEDYGFSFTQAHYGVTHADIDWNLYAESRLTEYILMNGEDGAIGVPQVDIELYMGFECGFSDEAIKYAFESAPIHKDEEGNYYYNFA